jgi:two-component system sensor histidine kinase AlgZ
MCVMLADFLRRSLALGGHREITLAEELDLAERYLEIERVRFGDRLRLERDVAPQTLRCAVPALLLQPLVENSVTHGIAHSLEGGAVRLAARRSAGRLEIEIDNPADPDRPASRGQGLGLSNVRSRLASLHPGATRVESREVEGRFHIVVLLPAVERAPDARPAAASRAPSAPAEVA